MPSTFEGEVLLLNNADVEKLLTIERVIAALDEAYIELDKGLTANRPRTGAGTKTLGVEVSWPENY